MIRIFIALDNMERINFEKFLNLISNDLYSFAFILIPDDLQAGQLVVDAIQSYLVLKKDKIEELLVLKNTDLSKELNLIKRSLLKTVFDLAKKRHHQLRLSISNSTSKNDFFSLEFDEKSVLFLRDKLKFSLEEVSIILNMTLTEVQAYLFSARNHMIEKIPYAFQAGVDI